MPIYEFRCSSCNRVHEYLLYGDEIGEQRYCQDCGYAMLRIPSKTNFSMLTTKKMEIYSKQFGKPIQSDADLRRARNVTSDNPRGDTIEMSASEYKKIENWEPKEIKVDRRRLRDSAEKIQKRASEDQEFHRQLLDYQESSNQAFNRAAAETAILPPKE